MTVQASLALVVGLLLIGLGSSKLRDATLSPGRLTVHHQGGTQGVTELQTGAAGEVNCAVCHLALTDAMVSNTLGWMSAAFYKEDKLTQNKLCLECHGSNWVSAPNFPHGLPPDVLEAHTADVPDEERKRAGGVMLTLASTIRSVPMTAEGELACATCHHEHRGRLFDLKRMDDRQCQVCHVQQFKSFNKGHPEFASVETGDLYTYPYRRRTRIIFDHWSHQQEHFGPGRPFDCATCHVPDERGRDMRLASFETSCAECHLEKDILSKDPLPFLGFGLSSDAWEFLDEEQLLTDFPKADDKGLSKFLLLLTEGDERLAGPESAEARAVYEEDLAVIEGLDYRGDLSGLIVDFYDDYLPDGLEYEGPEQFLDTIAEFFAVLEIQDDGDAAEPELVARLRRLAGDRPLSQGRIQALLGPFAKGSSFSSTLREVAGRMPLQTGGWIVEDSGHRIAAHDWRAIIRDIPQFAAVKDAGVGGPAVEWFENMGEVQAWLNQHLIMTEAEWFFRSGHPRAGDPVDASGWMTMLAAIPGFEDLAEADDDPEDAESPEPDDAPAVLQDFNNWMSNPNAFRGWLTDRVDVTGVAWLLKGPRFASKAVTAHSDAFLVEWLDFAGGLYAERASARILFDHLVNRLETSCMKCHSIDVQRRTGQAGEVVVNWFGGTSSKQFTQFNHGPHMKIHAFDCADCHQPVVDLDRLDFLLGEYRDMTAQLSGLADGTAERHALQARMEDNAAERGPLVEMKGNYIQSFKAEGGESISTDFTRFWSNFAGVSKDLCARCHTAQDAGNTCLVCHNYHVQDVRVTGMTPSLDALVAARARELPRGDLEDFIGELNAEPPAATEAADPENDEVSEPIAE